MATWNLQYLGSFPLQGVVYDGIGPKPDLGVQLDAALKAKGKGGEKERVEMKLTISLESIRGDARAGVSFHQPTARLTYVAKRAERGFRKKVLLVAMVASDDESPTGYSGATYSYRLFKCDTEEDASKLEFAVGRAMVNFTQIRPVPLQSADQFYSIDRKEREAHVDWYNSAKPPLLQLKLTGSGDTVDDWSLRGVLRVRYEDGEDASATHVATVSMGTELCGDELIKYLGPKFNLEDVNFSDYGLYASPVGGGEARLLDTSENPLLVSFTWADPTECTFVLRRLAAARADSGGSLLASRNSTSRALSPSERSTLSDAQVLATLGPQLPFGPEDEDLLLAVMVARQTGSGLGFQLTPAYLLQMCVAHSLMAHNDAQTASFLSKVVNAVGTVLSDSSDALDATSDSSDALDVIFFWVLNAVRLLQYLQGPASQIAGSTAAAAIEVLEANIEYGVGMLLVAFETGAARPAGLDPEAPCGSNVELRAAVEAACQRVEAGLSREALDQVVSRLTSALPARGLAAGVPLDARASEGEGAGGLEPLPAEWEELVDHETKHRFFANHQTRQTSWTDPRDKLVAVTLLKGDRGLGLGISGARRTRNDSLIMGIFVSSIVADSAAALESSISEGDEILEVNGNSLIGVQREGAIEFLKQVEQGAEVQLLVAKEPKEWVNPDTAKASSRHTAL